MAPRVTRMAPKETSSIQGNKDGSLESLTSLERRANQRRNCGCDPTKRLSLQLHR